jgi:IclR family pca regulon transcriptional regulator
MTDGKLSAAAAVTEPAAGSSRSKVNSLAKGLRVLEAFSAHQPEMTLSEVAVAAHLDPGTCFRMLNTLAAVGYVARIPNSKRFRLTLKVVDLGFHAIARTDLREIARPILRSLVGEVSEAASLGVIEGGDVLYIERVRAGIARLGVDIRIGTTIPAAASAIGQSMLAFMATAERDRVLVAPPRPGGMPSTRMSQPELDAALAEARELGYVVRDSIFTMGLRVLAVPVRDIDGHAVAAVSVAAPAARATLEEFRTRLLQPVRSAARDIGRALQAGGSTMLAL